MRCLVLVALLVGVAMAFDAEDFANYTSSSLPPTPSSSPAPEPSSSPAPEPSSSLPPAPSSSAHPEPSPSPTPAPPSPGPKSSHNHTLYADCIRVDFDALAIVDGLGRSLNVSNVTAASTIVIGGCAFEPNPKNASFNIHVASVTGTLTAGSSMIEVIFTFVENALYSLKNEYISGDRSVSLQSITTTTTIATKAQQDEFDMSSKWSVAANSSFNCNYYFNFTGNAASPKASLQLGNIQAQAFLPAGASAFSPSGANSVNCPAIIKLKTNKVGLIIGGIIAALSVFGILSFACSKCKNSSRDGYRSLNDSV